MRGRKATPGAQIPGGTSDERCTSRGVAVRARTCARCAHRRVSATSTRALPATAGLRGTNNIAHLVWMVLASECPERTGHLLLARADIDAKCCPWPERLSDRAVRCGQRERNEQGERGEWVARRTPSRSCARRQTQRNARTPAPCTAHTRCSVPRPSPRRSLRPYYCSSRRREPRPAPRGRGMARAHMRTRTRVRLRLASSQLRTAAQA